MINAFRYLGYNLNTKDADHLSNWSCLVSLQQTQTCTDSLKARISLLESLVRSKLLYSVQAWQLSSKSKNKLEVVYRRFLRKNGQEW